MFSIIVAVVFAERIYSNSMHCLPMWYFVWRKRRITNIKSEKNKKCSLG